MTKVNRIAVALLASLVMGCSNMGLGEKQYACAGRPEGFTCKSALEVYELTDSDDWQTEVEAEREASAEGRGGRLEASATSAIAVAADRPALPEMNTGTIPLRTPARVLRIWIAPWEDDGGDLHMPGLVYTEVESRRWQVGLSEPSERDAVRPLRVR
jgi:conjugal transfer pilus assembly protein TraV